MTHITTHIYRNSILPFRLVLASVRHPSEVRFYNDKNLLFQSRALLVAFLLRISFMLSLILSIVGNGISTAILYLIFLFLIANLLASLQLHIGVSILGFFGKVFLGRRLHKEILHPFSLSYLSVFVPGSLIEGYLSTSYALGIIIEIFFALRSKHFNTKEALMVFLIPRILILLVINLVRYTHGLLFPSV